MSQKSENWQIIEKTELLTAMKTGRRLLYPICAGQAPQGGNIGETAQTRADYRYHYQNGKAVTHIGNPQQLWPGTYLGLARDLGSGQILEALL